MALELVVSWSLDGNSVYECHLRQQNKFRDAAPTLTVEIPGNRVSDNGALFKTELSVGGAACSMRR
jgi:hypothetical protein